MLLVVLVTARENVTQVGIADEKGNFLGKYPQLTIGIFTGLLTVGIVCGFCCCALLCYICIRTQTQGPTMLQSLGNSLRRTPVNLVEAHRNEFSSRHTYEEVADREAVTPMTPRDEQPPKLPPRPDYQTPIQSPTISRAPRPEPASTPAPTLVKRGPPPPKPKRKDTGIPAPAKAQASTSAGPQPKMGIKVRKTPTPKNRGTFKPRNKYYNLDPVLVQREHILTHHTEAPNKEVVEPPIKRMTSFKPRGLWAELDGPTLAKARLSNISLKAFPEAREQEQTTTPPNTPTTTSEEEEEYV